MRDFFYDALHWALGVEPAAAGEGVTSRIEWHHPWVPWVLLLLAMLAVAFVVGVYVREGRAASRGYKLFLAGLRLLLIAMVLLMLAEPWLVVHRTDLPYVLVLADASDSMSIADHYRDAELREAAAELAASAGFEEATRFNLARAILLRDDGALLRDLLEDHHLRIYHVAETAVSAADFTDPEGLDAFLRDLRGRRYVIAEHAGGSFTVTQQDAQDAELREYASWDEIPQPIRDAAEPQTVAAGDSATAVREWIARLPQARGEQSRLGAGLRRVLNDLRGRPPAAVIFLTDGINTDGEPLVEAAQLAEQRGVPLFTVALGDVHAPRDVELSELQVDEVVFVNDTLEFLASVRGTGYEGEQTEVVLRERGSETPLATVPVTIPRDGQPVEVMIEHRATEVGEFDFVVEVRPFGEDVEGNNALERHVSVHDDQIRVLLVDGQPRYEFRYLKALLERDDTIELHTVLQEADPEYAIEDETALPHFPVSRDELFQYDVILLGDVNPQRPYLNPADLENIAAFVGERGGGLLMIAGTDFSPLAYRGTPLADLLPIDLEDARVPSPEATLTESFRPSLTPEGRELPMFRFGDDEAQSQEIWQNLPPLFWMVQAPETKPAAVVLAEGPARDAEPLPLFVMQFYRAGKVFFSATDETWRWRFRVGDRYFGRFWIQTIRFLARSRLLGRDRSAELTVDRRQYRRGDTVRLRVRFLDESLAPAADDGVVVRVARTAIEDGRERETYRVDVPLERVAPGSRVFEGVFTNAPEGSYRATMITPPPPPPRTDASGDRPGVPEATFQVQAPPGERENVQADWEGLQQAAGATAGGRFFTLLGPQASPTPLPPGYAPELPIAALADAVPHGSPVELDPAPPISLWNEQDPPVRWWVLGLFVGIIGLEWVLRKRRRML